MGAHAVAAETNYPMREITLVVPFTRGANRHRGRIVADQMSASLGQPITIETSSGRAA